MVTQTPQTVVDESKVQTLVSLLEESVPAWLKTGPWVPDGAESKLYSYINYVEKRIIDKFPRQQAMEASTGIWGAVSLESCDPQEIAASVRLQNPRLPGKTCKELARRILAVNVTRRAAVPTYDKILRFLGLEWAFDDGMPGSCSDAIDQEFVDSTVERDFEIEVIGEYEDPFSEVDMSIVMGPETDDEARRLIGIAQTVNDARMEWRREHGHQSRPSKAA